MSPTEVITSEETDYVGGRIMEIINHYGLNKNSFSMRVGLKSNAYIVRIVNDPETYGSKIASSYIIDYYNGFTGCLACILQFSGRRLALLALLITILCKVKDML
jgi:hypothetical protein